MPLKIVLLSPNPPDCVSFGPRQLASVLRERGHAVSIVFLRGSVGLNQFDAGHIYRYPPSLLSDVIDACRGADVVGVSFMSLYYDRAVQLTRAVQDQLGKAVIWGGTHPSLRPETSVQIADYVCVGEGEIAFSEWLDRWERGGDLTSVPGIWARTGGRVFLNGEAPEVPDLDAIPWPDMDTEGHWVDLDDRLVPMDTDQMRRVLPRLPHFRGEQRIGVRVMATRGCPHKCTYCASSAQTRMRRRSPESTVAHLAWLKARYPFLGAMYEFDDTFFATPQRWLDAFCDGYRRDVGLPWHCQTSPSTLTRKRLDQLVSAGLVYCEMGIQSGSDEIKALFQRSETDGQVREAAALLHEFWRDGRLVEPRYHVITDVPWESAESVRQTVALMLDLPRPFTLAIGSLCLFPGTHLNDRARSDGLLHDEVNEVYRKPFLQPRRTVLNALIEAAAVDALPKPLLRRLADPTFLARWARGGGDEPDALGRALHLVNAALDRAPRAARAVFAGDLDRIRRRLHQPR